jgi:hypothetical protein
VARVASALNLLLSGLYALDALQVSFGEGFEVAVDLVCQSHLLVLLGTLKTKKMVAECV